MVFPPDAPCGPSRGRPRDDAREQAILDAALELLVEVGFERMSIVAIAARARASKATIYRRWPGKVELVVEAIKRRGGGETMLPDTGTLRGDLLAMGRAIIDTVAEGDAALMPGIVLAMRDCPELASALRCRMREEKLAVARCVADRACARGELPSPDRAYLIHEIVPAMIFFRLLVTGEPLDDAFLTHLVDDVLVPLVSRPLVTELDR